MSSTDEVRWHQRYESFSKALRSLETACEQETYSELERAGLIQMFMFTYELGWKVMKDLLDYEGYSPNSPRQVIRQSFESGYLDQEDCEIFLLAVEKRNTFSHTYDEEEALKVEEQIKSQFHPMFKRVHRTLREKRIS